MVTNFSPYVMAIYDCILRLVQPSLVMLYGVFLNIFDKTPSQIATCSPMLSFRPRTVRDVALVLRLFAHSPKIRGFDCFKAFLR